MSVQNTLERMSRGSEVVKANLVVNDDMDRAAGGVTTGLRQCKGFLIHTLTTKGRVTVDQNRQVLACPTGPPRRSMRARTEPSTTGFTISR
jgi:hypothetical protein